MVGANFRNANFSPYTQKEVKQRMPAKKKAKAKKGKKK
jgi:hypothetical protein